MTAFYINSDNITLCSCRNIWMNAFDKVSCVMFGKACQETRFRLITSRRNLLSFLNVSHSNSSVCHSISISIFTSWMYFMYNIKKYIIRRAHQIRIRSFQKNMLFTNSTITIINNATHSPASNLDGGIHSNLYARTVTHIKYKFYE